ncbi:MAG: hydroxymethylglutaryl-CoA synthase [Pseudomonadota bacterium]
MDVSILGYGVSIPSRRITIEQIHHVWKNMPLAAVKGRGVKERAVIGPDEDTVTLGAEAAFKAIEMSGLDPGRIGALFLGTQTSPYLTRPAASILVEALGLSSHVLSADVQFSGKSGTTALLLALSCVKSGMAEAALAIGADTLSYHVAPGDSQEYVLSSGAGAVVVSAGEGIAVIENSASFTTDTLDYFRLDGERYIRTGGAAMTNTDVGFQKNAIGAWEGLNAKHPHSSGEFNYLVIQQGDGRTPFRIGKKLGFSKDQITPGLIADLLGDCGAASPLISLARVLDRAQPDEKIAMISYGEGAGSDAIVVKTSKSVEDIRHRPHVDVLISRKRMIDYATYIKLERKFHTHERKVSTFD